MLTLGSLFSSKLFTENIVTWKIIRSFKKSIYVTAATVDYKYKYCAAGTTVRAEGLISAFWPMRNKNLTARVYEEGLHVNSKFEQSCINAEKCEN